MWCIGGLWCLSQLFFPIGSKKEGIGKECRNTTTIHRSTTRRQVPATPPRTNMSAPIQHYLNRCHGEFRKFPRRGAQRPRATQNARGGTHWPLMLIAPEPIRTPHTRRNDCGNERGLDRHSETSMTGRGDGAGIRQHTLSTQGDSQHGQKNEITAPSRTMVR